MLLALLFLAGLPVGTATPAATSTPRVVFDRYAASFSGPDDRALHDKILVAINRDVLPPIRVCYGKLLEKTPSAYGTLTVSFRVESGGTLGSIHVSSDQSSISDTEKCASSTLALLNMPLGDADDDGERPSVTFALVLGTAPAPQRKATTHDALSATPVVLGSLEPEVIARVMRSHLYQIKHCYERELLKRSSLAGKFTLKFVVGASGSVTSASTEGSTLADGDAVESCAVAAVKTFTFPKPAGGGIVTVRHPIILESAGN